MRAVALTLAACAAVFAGASAPAQDAAPDDWRLGMGRETFVRDSPETPQIRIDIGWGGSFIAWRWNPMRVHITGGERPVGGQVIVHYAGNDGGAVRIGAPYGVAPGSTTTVEALVPVASYLERLVVEITDENGRPLRRDLPPAASLREDRLHVRQFDRGGRRTPPALLSQSDIAQPPRRPRGEREGEETPQTPRATVRCFGCAGAWHVSSFPACFPQVARPRRARLHEEIPRTPQKVGHRVVTVTPP